MTIALSLTPAAKDALAKDISRSELKEPVVSVLWGESGHRTANGSFEVKGAKWGIGFYEANRLPANAFEPIEGFTFAFVQGTISERLNGKTLDFVGGKYVVI